MSGWLDRLIRRHRWHVVREVDAADEIPDHLPVDGAILVGNPLQPRWLAFDCPCNTGHRIMLNLDRSRYPYWTIVDPHRLTLWPSVDSQLKGLRCHYFLRRGKVVWVPAWRERSGDRR